MGEGVGLRPAAAIVALLLAACSSTSNDRSAARVAPASPPVTVTTAPPASAGAPSTSASSLPAVSLGVLANGRTVVLQVGQRLVVRLAANWTAPTARTPVGGVTSGLQPLRSDWSVGFPAVVIGAAAFTAIRVGEAAVLAQTDYACLHVPPRCALTQDAFAVTIRVQPRPGQRAGPLPQPPHS